MSTLLIVFSDSLDCFCSSFTSLSVAGIVRRRTRLVAGVGVVGGVCYYSYHQWAFSDRMECDWIVYCLVVAYHFVGLGPCLIFHSSLSLLLNALPSCPC